MINISIPRLAVGAALAVAFSGAVAQAQGTTPFTARDALGVTATSVVDLSVDGRWLLVTASLRGDALGIDFRRDGDPTYIRPGRTKVQLIETATGTARDVLAAAMNVRQAALSRDGSKVALLVERAGGGLELSLWDRGSGKRTPFLVPNGQGIAENSDLRFTRDGRAVYVMLRSAAQSAALKAEFERVTKGPVFVQDGSDPFLAWDAMRRQGKHPLHRACRPNERQVHRARSRNGDQRLPGERRRLARRVPAGRHAQDRLRHHLRHGEPATGARDKRRHASFHRARSSLRPKERPSSGRRTGAASPTRRTASSTCRPR